MSAFIDENRGRFGVEPICREIEVSASAHRARRTRPPSARALRDAWLLEQIRRVHDESQGIYGQLKVWDELNESGIRVARRTIERLMRTYGICGVGPAKTTKTTLPGAAPVAAADLVRRDFRAGRPDELSAGRLHLRAHLGGLGLPGDRARRVHAAHRRLAARCPHASEPRDRRAFEMALAARQEHAGGLVAHSDDGCRYTSYEYTERLQRAGIVPSRGRTGTALDNAMAESVISTLKRELISRYRWPTRLDLELALVSYIGWYNSRRRHRSLKQTGKERIRRLAPQQMLDLYNQKTVADSMASK